jgi:hypothetical protein
VVNQVLPIFAEVVATCRIWCGALSSYAAHEITAQKHAGGAHSHTHTCAHQMCPSKHPHTHMHTHAGAPHSSARPKRATALLAAQRLKVTLCVVYVDRGCMFVCVCLFACMCVFMCVCVLACTQALASCCNALLPR